MLTACSKLVSWRYTMEKIHGIHKVLLQFKKSLLILFYTTAETANCYLLKTLGKHFCNLIYKKQKNFVKHIENLPQHLS